MAFDVRAGNGVAWRGVAGPDNLRVSEWRGASHFDVVMMYDFDLVMYAC